MYMDVSTVNHIWAFFGYFLHPHILPAINFSSSFLLRFSAARFLAFQRRALNSSNENSSMPQYTLSLQYMGTNTPASVSVACRRLCSGSVCLGAFLALRSMHTLWGQYLCTNQSKQMSIFIKEWWMLLITLELDSPFLELSLGSYKQNEDTIN